MRPRRALVRPDRDRGSLGEHLTARTSILRWFRARDGRDATRRARVSLTSARLVAICRLVHDGRPDERAIEPDGDSHDADDQEGGGGSDGASDGAAVGCTYRLLGRYRSWSNDEPERGASPDAG